MKVKPLCEYNITTLYYIENTLVLFNEMYGVKYISRDRDGELSPHNKYPKISRYDGIYSRDTEIMSIARFQEFFKDLEELFQFKFSAWYDQGDSGSGVLIVEEEICRIREAIEEKKNYNNLVYMRLKKCRDKELRVMYALVSEYKRIGYEYVTSFYDGGQIVFWSTKPYKDKEGRWTSKGDGRVFENIDGLLFYTDWPVRKEDDSFVHVSEILQAIIKLDEERNGTIFSNHSFRQAVDKTFALESDIQAAIDKYRRELEVAKNG